jgi:hypothetical protein
MQKLRMRRHLHAKSAIRMQNPQHPPSLNEQTHAASASASFSSAIRIQHLHPHANPAASAIFKRTNSSQPPADLHRI